MHLLSNIWHKKLQKILCIYQNPILFYSCKTKRVNRFIMTSISVQWTVSASIWSIRRASSVSLTNAHTFQCLNQIPPHVVPRLPFLFHTEMHHDTDVRCFLSGLQKRDCKTFSADCRLYDLLTEVKTPAPSFFFNWSCKSEEIRKTCLKMKNKLHSIKLYYGNS